MELNKVRDEIDDFKIMAFNSARRNLQIIYHDSMRNTEYANQYMEIIYYLFSVEGFFTYSINIIILFYIKHEHQILKMRNRKNVETFDDLSQVQLSQKISFLEKHGFTDLNKLYNRDLRNAIAHMQIFVSRNFNVDSEVQYMRAGKLHKVKVDQIEEWNQNLYWFHAIVNTQLGAQLKD